jgi:hypothetical protein
MPESLQYKHFRLCRGLSEFREFQRPRANSFARRLSEPRKLIRSNPSKIDFKAGKSLFMIETS